MAAMAVDVKNALALAATVNALDNRVRSLELVQASNTAGGIKSSQVWQTVFHGITTLIALGLSAAVLFNH